MTPCAGSCPARPRSPASMPRPCKTPPHFSKKPCERVSHPVEMAGVPLVPRSVDTRLGGVRPGRIAARLPKDTPVPNLLTRRAVAVLAGAALIAGGSLVAATPAFAVPTTIHVATSGNDTTGDGTAGLPYATIGQALSAA